MVPHQALHIRRLNAREGPSSIDVRCKHTVCYALTQLGKRLHQTLIEAHRLAFFMKGNITCCDIRTMELIDCPTLVWPAHWPHFHFFNQFCHFVTSRGATTTPGPTYTYVLTYLSLVLYIRTYTHRAISILSTHSAAWKHCDYDVKWWSSASWYVHYVNRYIEVSAICLTPPTTLFTQSVSACKNYINFGLCIMYKCAIHSYHLRTLHRSHNQFQYTYTTVMLS